MSNRPSSILEVISRIKILILQVVMCISFCLFGLKSIRAQQIYTDVGVHFNTYTKTGPLNPIGGISMPMLRLGFGVHTFKDEKFSLNVETGFHRRAMKLNYPERSFDQRTDVFMIGMNADYRVTECFILEAGLFPLLTVTRLNPVPGFLGAFDMRLDDGYRYFDLEFALGTALYPHKNVGIGARGRGGLIPMLKYREIGDYGELKDPETFLRSWTLELFIRILWRTRD